MVAVLKGHQAGARSVSVNAVGDRYAPAQKSRETLIQQLDRISHFIGENQSIAPTTLKSGLIEEQLATLKANHPIRYQIYLAALRNEHSIEGRRSIDPEALKQLKELNRLDNYIERHLTGIDQTLRPKQMEVFKALRERLERGERSGYVKLPLRVPEKPLSFQNLLKRLGEDRWLLFQRINLSNRPLNGLSGSPLV